MLVYRSLLKHVKSLPSPDIEAWLEPFRTAVSEFLPTKHPLIMGWHSVKVWKGLGHYAEG